MTLKVGDKVRVKRSMGGLAPGDLTVVIGHGSLYPYRVRDEKGGIGGGTLMRHDELEKIEEPAPKFKVGDRVRWSGSESGAYRIAGRSRDLDHKDPNFDWRLENITSGRRLNAYEYELTKIESVPFKLERGDKVVNRKTNRMGFVQAGQVWDIDNLSAQPVPTAAIEEYEEHYPGTYDLIKKDAPW
jgi:hypothetical protein